MKAGELLSKIFPFRGLARRAIRKRIQKIYQYYEEQKGAPLTDEEKRKILQDCIDAIKWYQEHEGRAVRKTFDVVLRVFEEELQKLGGKNG